MKFNLKWQTKDFVINKRDLTSGQVHHILSEKGCTVKQQKEVIRKAIMGLNNTSQNFQLRDRPHASVIKRSVVRKTQKTDQSDIKEELSKFVTIKKTRGVGRCLMNNKACQSH